MAKRLGVPVRYVPFALKFGHVPIARLRADIRFGGPLRRDALRELRKSVPFQSLAWLDHVAKYGLWNELLLSLAGANSSEEVNEAVLRSTVAWLHRTSDMTIKQPFIAEQSFDF